MQRQPCSALRPLRADSVQGRSVLDVDLRLPRRAEVHWNKMQRVGGSGVSKVCALWGCEASGTHQVLPMTRVPAGRNQPSYQSSAVSLWGIARCQGVKYNNNKSSERASVRNTRSYGVTQWNHGMPTERLLEDRRHIWQQWPVPKIGKAVLAHHRVNFRLRSSLHLGIEDHREEERMKHRHGLRRS